MSHLIRWIVRGAILVTLTGIVVQPFLSNASDHDDGEMDVKGRSLNLTDVYAFREDWQDSSGSSQKLVLIMNTNPRSLARQQYFFSTKARYDFHISRVQASEKSIAPKGKDDVILRFEFGSPDKNNRQAINLTLVKDNFESKALAGSTTSLADASAGASTVTSVRLADHTVDVFAGLREDSFFFDVERYFRVRGFLATGINTLGSGPIQGGANVFRSDSTAVDFTTGYNVNSIAIKVPISLLQSNLSEPIFDTWATISIPE